MREQFNDDETLIDTISQGSDFIDIGGTRKHVISYLEDFLFSPQRARSPVKSLSGGERNRLLLARLFTRPANVLVLDEPTNDLDIETLELLEALLQSYSGTLFLVSHDREFLDNVVTQVIAFEGDGNLREYVGGYDDWMRAKKFERTMPRQKEPQPAVPKVIRTLVPGLSWHTGKRGNSMNCPERSRRLNRNRRISETGYVRQIFTGIARKKPEPCINASRPSKRNS